MPNPNYAIYRQGSLRGDKIQYPDGIGCCVWYPMCSYEGNAEDNEDTGICFDFSLDDLDDLIILLQQLKTAKADIYTEPKKIEDNSDLFSQNITLLPLDK